MCPSSSTTQPTLRPPDPPPNQAFVVRGLHGICLEISHESLPMVPHADLRQRAVTRTPGTLAYSVFLALTASPHDGNHGGFVLIHAGSLDISCPLLSI